jgi:hypothetical protein
MRYRRPAQSLLGSLALTALLPGCLSYYRDRPVTVLVRDAETHQPIPSAQVKLSFPMARSDAPDPKTEATGPDGIARMKTSPNGKDALKIEASANGYLADSRLVPDMELEEIQPAGYFESSSRRPPRFYLEMYSGPDFTVELVVPTYYRGLVKATIQIADKVPCPPHQRNFVFTVRPDGGVDVSGPTVLRHVAPANYHVRYADGTILRDMDKDHTGFRWLKHQDNAEYFVVGTLQEYENFRRQMYPDEPADSTSSPKSGGGGGGRGGKGGRGGGGGGF